MRKAFSLHEYMPDGKLSTSPRYLTATCMKCQF